MADDRRRILAQLWENRETLIVAASAASAIYILHAIHQTLLDQQAFDIAWEAKDAVQEATALESMEQIKTNQGRILGKLEGSGDLVYQLGLRDGRQLCVPH